MTQTGSPSLPQELAQLARLEAPAVAVVDRLLRAAAEARASDLHVDPEPDAWVIRLRLDGVLQQVASVSREQVPTLVRRLKVLADLPTYVTDLAQDGRIPAERSAGAGDVRLAVLPTIHGSKAVVRLFLSELDARELDGLGLPQAAQDALARASLAPQGVIVLCGPAGSGKSTTIHATLRHLLARAGGTRSVVGIEDPVEQVLPGITQAQVDTAAGFGFPQALRAFLRQDPQVIYLGECRDAETARVAIQAGLTGHLVITTLHAGSRAQVFSRLLEMGLEPHLLTSALSLVMAQRLVRRVCSQCASADTELPVAVVDALGAEGLALRAVGCSACQGTGYQGRTLLVEQATLTSEVRGVILERGDESALARALPGETLRQHGLSQLARGVTTLAELERVLGPLG